MSYVTQQLSNAASVYENRNALYKDNYKRFGPAMFEMIGQITLKSPEDFNRFAIFIQMFAKITRYAAMFNEGGHADSLDDLSVYSMMLKELDAEETEDTAAASEDIPF